MGPEIFAIICILICIAALYFAFKIYKDTRKIKKKQLEEDDETPLRF